MEMLAGYTIVILGISLLIEGWREVYKATQENRLATDGLYGVVRHPQYTGIFFRDLRTVDPLADDPDGNTFSSGGLGV